MGRDRVRAGLGELHELASLFVKRAEASAEALVQHLRAAGGEVRDLAHHVGVDARDEILEVEVHVVRRAAELARVVVAERARRQVVEVGAGVHERALRLGHLLAVDGEEAVHEHLRGRLEPGGMEHAGPEEAVEADDVLADEVVELGVRIVPPVLKLLAVGRAPVGERGDVADRRVHPHVEELPGMAGDLEAEVRRVARDAPAAQRLLEPLEQLVGDVARRVGGDPLLKILVLGLKLEVEVFGVPYLGRGAAGRAHGMAELLGAVRGAALVAAVAVLVLGTALRACALHVAVGQEHAAVRAVELGRALRRDAAALLGGGENAFRQFLVLGRVGGVVVVERDLEVGEVLQVRLVAARNELLRRNALGARADHHRRAVRVVRAHVHAFMAAHLLETDPEVGLDVLDQVAEVDVPVRVGERARDDNAAFI